MRPVWKGALSFGLVNTVIEKKAEGRAVATPPAARKPPTKVVDLMQALEASLAARRVGQDRPAAGPRDRR